MSNLLQKASIVTTPTAYGVGVLNSIKPAYALGSELVTNGNFSNGTTGWTPNATATLSIDDGRLKVAISGGAFGLPLQNITTEVGKKYIITANAYIGTATKVSLYSPAIGFNDLTADGSYNLTFTATSTSTQIRLYVYGDGSYGFWDNVSVKKVTDADFDFTRTSSATRVNPDYLIETVSINSANLVQNGNFSELGSELVTNGNFETDSNWTKGTGWSISNGKAVGSNSSSSLYQATGSNYTSGKTYKIVFTVSDYVSGSVRPEITNIAGDYVTSNGTFTQYIVATSSGIGEELKGASFNGSIDNVSVKQVDPNDNWTLVGGSTITDTLNIISTDGSLSSGKQLNVLEIGKKYKYSFDITSYTSGSLFFIEGSTTVLSGLNATGTYTGQFISTGTSIEFKRGGVSNASFDNISVIEIQENGVPRLDYTNGTASILLEPQSTNLINFSEPTSSETTASGITYESYIWAVGHFTNCIKFGDNSQTRYRYFTGTIANSTAYVISAFVIMDDLSEPTLGTNSATGNFILRVGGTSASTGNLPNVNMGNSIYRVSSVITSGAGGGTTGLLKYTTQSNIGFRIVGFQVEEQSYPTSYIPTSGATITRAAETLNNAGNSDLINSTEGVLYCEIAALANDGTFRQLTLSDNSTSDRVSIDFTSTDNQIRSFSSSGGGTVANMTGSVSNATQFNKVAVKYKLNDYALWINGVEVATDTSGAAPIGLSKLAFDNGGGSNDFYGKVKTVAVFKEALSDTELACLTSTNNREIFLNYYYRMQYVGANTEALSCAEQTFNI